jgi:hypothetical protein
VFVHCVAVVTLLCIYTAGWVSVFHSLHFEYDYVGPYVALLLFEFVIPTIFAGVTAWLSYRYILAKVARTESGEKISGALVMLFAIVTPFYMPFVLFFVG